MNAKGEWRIANRFTTAIAARLSVLTLLSTPALADDRLLGLALTDHSERAYDQAAAIAAGIGVRYATIPLPWDEFETSPGVYAPESDWLGIATAFYPTIGWKVALELNPIDTVADRRPLWLRGRAWDAPEVVAAYRAAISEALKRSSKLDIVSFALGNEVDVLLSEDAAAWEGYIALVKSARETARAKRPSLRIGVKITFPGATGSAAAYAQTLARSTDLVMVTYYPLDADYRARAPETVEADIAALARAFEGRAIHLAEIGYPSSAACAGGEDAQARFVAQFFQAWDRHAAQIEAVYWDWMTDISPSEVQAATEYYGASTPCFAEFIGTLGLESHGLAPKAGWQRFAEEARQRLH